MGLLSQTVGLLKSFQLRLNERMVIREKRKEEIKNEIHALGKYANINFSAVECTPIFRVIPSFRKKLNPSDYICSLNYIALQRV